MQTTVIDRCLDHFFVDKYRLLSLDESQDVPSDSKKPKKKNNELANYRYRLLFLDESQVIQQKNEKKKKRWICPTTQTYPLQNPADLKAQGTCFVLPLPCHIGIKIHSIHSRGIWMLREGGEPITWGTWWMMIWG